MTPDATQNPAARSIVVTNVDIVAGAERSLLALSSWLHQAGLAHQILCYTDTADLAAHAPHPLTVTQLKPPSSVPGRIAALNRYFAANPSPYKPLTSGYQPALHATAAGLRGFHNLMHDTPTLFSVPVGSFTLPQRLNRVFSDRVVAHGLRSGGRTIVTSQFLQEDTLRIFHVHADIARMGGLAQEDGMRPRPVTDKLRLFSVSRLEGNKRLDWILRGLATLEHADIPLSRRVDWHLDITGKGPMLEPLKQMAAELGIAGRVTLHGYVSDERLHELYDQAHLFLMPALQGYGIPAIEALQRGIPVLLHRESGVSDILLDTPWAIVMHGGEESFTPALATALDSVIEGRQLNHPLPRIPTEAEWAEQVATLCEWV